MKPFSVIDFGTIEHPSNFKIRVRGTSDYYKSLKKHLQKHEGSNNFERWFSLNLDINDSLRCGAISIEESISLAYLLKKVENSNQELKETIRIWREDESKLSSTHKFYINNILLLYYKIVVDHCPPEGCKYNRHVHQYNWKLDRFIKFSEDYKPRLLNSSDFFIKRQVNYSESKIQNIVNIINKNKIGYHVLRHFLGAKFTNTFIYIYD